MQRINAESCETFGIRYSPSSSNFSGVQSGRLVVNSIGIVMFVYSIDSYFNVFKNRGDISPTKQHI